MRDASIVQEDKDSFVIMARMPAGAVKVSFFGNVTIGRIGEPLLTSDGTLLVASLEDLAATKLKAILDRAEAKDYCDMAAMLSAGVNLERALGVLRNVRQRPRAAAESPRLFDGDLPSLPRTDQDLLRAARDRVSEILEISVTRTSLAIPLRHRPR